MPVVCLPNSLAVKIIRNKQCASAVSWRYNSPSISSINYINDSTASINFTGNFQGYIHATLNGCKAIEDSFFVVATAARVALNLGADQTICTGNTLLLHAGPGYANYQWQNNSTDSTLLISQPGKYFVKATDGCGNIFRDTIIISAAAPLLFTAGPDQTKCNADTLHLHASPGFFNYTWSNSYFLSNDTTADVTVSPLKDTAYYVKAEKTPGCFAFDTVRIKVYNSPSINLGFDKRICTGDSVLLNAGSGFVSYKWNNGASVPQIFGKLSQQYSVVATTFEGCKSMDTALVSILPVPPVSLNKQNFLCSAVPGVLNAGNFVSYRWNTGALTQTININSIGLYTVEVTDADGCKAQDSVRIQSIMRSPSLFLPADTNICSYETIALRPLTDFADYRWNTGTSSYNITIDQPGIYWLDATDKNGCKGRDSINVTQKDCLKGIYIPTVFTPNGDARNDIFKPIIFGKLISYQFTILNRLGQEMFSSTDRNKGWNGNIGGRAQNSQTYTYICIYQFEGEAKRIRKGTTILVR